MDAISYQVSSAGRPEPAWVRRHRNEIKQDYLSNDAESISFTLYGISDSAVVDYYSLRSLITKGPDRSRKVNDCLQLEDSGIYWCAAERSRGVQLPNEGGVAESSQKIQQTRHCRPKFCFRSDQAQHEVAVGREVIEMAGVHKHSAFLQKLDR